MNFLPLLSTTSIALFIYMNIFFFLSRIYKKISIVDIAWPGGFLLILIITCYFKNIHYIAPYQIILIALWGIRLISYLSIRFFQQGEDSRYKELTKTWGRREPLYSYVFIFLFQGLILQIVALPILTLGFIPQTSPWYKTLMLISALVMAIALVIESIADLQLAKHLKNTAGSLCKTGLWKYSSHPNYFGELLFWWGLSIFAILSNYPIIAILGPITLTFFVLFVSGIPLAEKQLERLPGFETYKKSTSILIPWFK